MRDASRGSAPRYAGDSRGLNGTCDVGRRHEGANIATWLTPLAGAAIRMTGGSDFGARHYAATAAALRSDKKRVVVFWARLVLSDI